MKKLKRSKLMLLGILVAAIGVSFAAYALADGAPGGTVAQMKSAPGPEAFVQSYGLTSSEGQLAFTLKDGESVKVLEKGSSRCLLHGVGSHFDGRCFPDAAVNEGSGISVYDECGTSGKNLMEITGLAPAGVSGVRLLSSDGTSQETSVVDGAFRFEGTNPGQGDPYPTSVQWIKSSSGAGGSAQLPVSGGQFCLPTS
jgi:hypothetical protein